MCPASTLPRSRQSSTSQLAPSISEDMRKQLDDAQDHVNKGNRKTKTTLKRWKPKYTQAGEEFCSAAQIYYACGNFNEAKKCLLRACDCFLKKRAWHNAAKTMEQAMIISGKQHDSKALVEFSLRAAALYRRAGLTGISAHTLENGARFIETTDPERAVTLLDKAAWAVETENCPLHAANYVEKIMRIRITQGKILEAIFNAKRLIELYQDGGHNPSVGRTTLGLVVLLLSKKFVSEAELCARDNGNYCNREQHEAIEDLLDSFDCHDEDKLKNAVKNRTLRDLDSEFYSVLGGISLPLELKRTKKHSRQRNVYIGKEEKKEEDKDSKKESTTVSPMTSDDERKEEQKAPVAKPEDLHTIDEENDDDKTQKKSSVIKKPYANWPAPRDIKAEVDKMKNSGRKRNAYVEMGSAPAPTTGKRDKSKTSKNERKLRRSSTEPEHAVFPGDNDNKPRAAAHVDFGTDSIDRHRPDNLPAPGVYVDVEGVDPVQPAYMGMTTEQMRAFKRSNATEDFGEGDFGEDFEDGDF